MAFADMSRLTEARDRIDALERALLASGDTIEYWKSLAKHHEAQRDTARQERDTYQLALANLRHDKETA